MHTCLCLPSRLRAAILFPAIIVAALGPRAEAVDPTWNYAVQVSATVQASPAQITLTWPQDTTATPTSHTVSRKVPGAVAWDAGIALPGSATQFIDTSVVPGAIYEYEITRTASAYSGYGYVQAGIAVPLREYRGKIILIVEASQSSILAPELSRLQQDLAGDGWTVLRHDVNRADPAANVKALIKADYTADPANVKSVFLFGHVPVPYSGRMAPDGHAEHLGAWPADVFYGDMTGLWTDSFVNSVQTLNSDPADCVRLTNIPGDGKFDQSGIPATVNLQLGRVDLSNMPGRVAGVATFPGESELLRQYLNKDHNFRHRLVSAQRRGIVGDYFGAMGGEAFAASGYRSFAPLVGSDHITNLNAQFGDTGGVWIPTLAANDYLFAYGCGPGTYQSMSGIGTTTEVVGNKIRAVFTLVVGSWLGDWDHEDNIMRSILATPDYGLAAAWSGRPHWFLHPMGLGETIGYCTQLTQNNGAGLYKNQINSSSGLIHVALMGDPTLALFPVAPATSLAGVLNASGATLTWGRSTDAVLGYHVYRGNSATGPFTRLTNSLIADPTFSDPGATTGMTYLVRAVKLEVTPSGSYYNASQSLFWSTGGALPTDTTAPTVAITAPANGTSTSGQTVLFAASATDNVAVVGVQFRLDGANLGAELTSPPYQTLWNASLAPRGPHSLVAIARDAAGNTSVSLPATLTLTSADTLAPSVAVTAPTAGATVAGSAALISVAATDNLGVVGVQIKIDGQNFGGELLKSPYTSAWNTTTLPDGPHQITAVARDAAGNMTTSPTLSVTVANLVSPPVINPSGIWIDDSLPLGSATMSYGGDRWLWTTNAPAPFSGSKAHQSSLSAGFHEHGFYNSPTPMAVAAGDTLVTYVYLDPVNPPSEIMLTWITNGTEHRAYWGANKIIYGKNNTPSRQHMGSLPRTGRWMRLEVTASDVGLVGQKVTGMTFSLYDGRATWDYSGKVSPGRNWFDAKVRLTDPFIAAESGPSFTETTESNSSLRESPPFSSAAALREHTSRGALTKIICGVLPK